MLAKEQYAAWLEGFGSLRFDAGKVTMDTDLAVEVLRRQGLIKNGGE